MNVHGKRVVIIGDSLALRPGGRVLRAFEVTSPDTTRSSSPGDIFASWLVRAGARSVILNAKGGRSAYSFFRSEDGDRQLAELIALRPDVIFVALGTNISTHEASYRKIVDILKRASIEVWGIGPPTLPNVAKAQEVVDVERRVYGRKFIDARALTQDLGPGMPGRSPDGVHFTTAGARVLGARYADVTGVMKPPSISKIKVGAIGLAIAALGFGLAYLVDRRAAMLQ